MTTSVNDEFEETRAALERSAAGLDADAAATPSPGFRARGRRALLGAGTGGTAAGSTARISRRLAASGAALLLFGLVAMPALAGHGPAAGPIASFANSIRHAVATRPATAEPDDSTFLGTPVGTPGVAVATPDPDWHGDAVSAVAHATPAPGENHGEMVRQVAKENHGHGYDGPGTATATAGATSTSTSTATTSGTATSSITATATGTATNHGSAVRVVAQETPPPGENHGQQVSAVARDDNHGQSVSSSHATATATVAATATGTAATSGNSGNNGGGQGSNGQGSHGQGNGGQGNHGHGR